MEDFETWWLEEIDKCLTPPTPERMARLAWEAALKGKTDTGANVPLDRLVMPDFQDQRQAAAWLIRTGRMILRSNVPISNFISRKDNNKNFEIGFHLIECGRRMAMGYELEQFTEATYKAHLRATRKA